jgi:hypothetical protein
LKSKEFFGLIEIHGMDRLEIRAKLSIPSYPVSPVKKDKYLADLVLEAR